MAKHEASRIAALSAAMDFYEMGRIEEAEVACAAVLAGNPHLPEAVQLAGLIALARGDAMLAVAQLQRAVSLAPSSALFRLNLGNAQRTIGDVDAAAASYAAATRLDPQSFAAWHNRGQLSLERSDPAAAVDALRHALALEPNRDDSRLALARALTAVESTDSYEETIGILTDHWQGSSNADEARFLLATALFGRNRRSAAVAHFEALVRKYPEHAQIHNQLANCYNKLGQMENAIVHYRETCRLAPTFHHARTSVLGCLNYVANTTPQEVFEAHQDWARAIAAPLYPADPVFPNDRDPDRPLRVGYVSPDFRRHPVASLFAPVLERHDAGLFESFCYHNFPGGDAMTERLKCAAGHWHDVAHLSDTDLASLVRRDRIDILIDLAGHTTRTRLLTFAMRPAPVQVGWLGYFNTTGLDTMNYFVTDPISSPSGQERYFSERLVRLPATRFPYEPPAYMPEISSLPADRIGRVTFGCLNHLGKVNARVLGAWARVLGAVSGSTLIVQATGLNDEEGREHFRVLAGEHGITADRLELRPFVPIGDSPGSYLDIDIALDPFPFGGGMTSFDALWMGIPVVTLAAEMIPGRQTVSMLHNLELPELIAANVDDYVKIATQLASDLPRLAELRAGLRERFRRSSLTDYATFARNLEAAYREMWRAWASEARG